MLYLDSFHAGRLQVNFLYAFLLFVNTYATMYVIPRFYC